MSDMSNYYKALVNRSYSFTLKIIGGSKNQRQNPEADLFTDRIFLKNKLALQLSEKRKTVPTNLESKLIIHMKKLLSLLPPTLQKKTFPDCLKDVKTFLVVQWFRLHVSTARGLGCIPSQGTKILHAGGTAKKNK